MSNHDQLETNVRQTTEPIKSRPVSDTEFSWCKSVPTGTGITVLALLLSEQPSIPLLQTALNNLQNSNPILRSKLHFDPTTSTFSFVTPSSPHIQVQPFDLSSTADIVSNNNNNNIEDDQNTIDPFQLILEHELNKNSWSLNLEPSSDGETSVFFVNLYTLSENRWALVLRLHTSVCDRAAAVALLRGLLNLVGGGESQEGGIDKEYENEAEVSLGIENHIPSGKANKPFWARGMDVLGYSLNSLRSSNLGFVDADSPRSSRVVRLQLGPNDTKKLVDGCKSRGIKLCGLLAAAGLIAARSSKELPDDQQEKYTVITLVDCRSILDPVLSSDHIGFYHSAILNSHDVSGGESLWELGKRCYKAFSDAKNNNKQFTDMRDLNFLMCKAIENPHLTPSSSMRTAFISVFEDPVIDTTNAMQGEIGLVGYIGCSSVHGVGPSIAIFDTIRDGQLDCACVYPWPLHSRDQMQKLIDDMKRILVDGSVVVEES